MDFYSFCQKVTQMIISGRCGHTETSVCCMNKLLNYRHVSFFQTSVIQSTKHQTRLSGQMIQKRSYGKFSLSATHKLCSDAQHTGADVAPLRRKLIANTK